MLKRLLVICSLGLGLLASLAQADGPAIKGFGPYVEIPDRAFKLPKGMHLKAVFDVRHISRSAGKPNPGLESVARLLNMHSASGKPPSEWEIAVVVHGKATRDILKNGVYRDLTGQDNPNLPLIKALKRVGVRFYVCGQSLRFSGWSANDMAHPDDLALSAMTALTFLQNAGYALLPQ